MECLKCLSKKDLVEIYWKINSWEWDERLGEKPADFDAMPTRDRTSKFQKYYILKPYYKEIVKRTTEKERLRYHHITNLQRTWFQFEVWWLQRLFRKLFLSYPF